MASFPRKRITLPLAPLAAGVLAALIALVVALLPAELLGSLVLDSGIAALVPAAEPPLGATARAALILIGGGGIGLIAWFTLFLLIGPRSMTIAGRAEVADDVPVLRRADAHPDAPARRPLFAAQDLGTPFLDVRAPVHVTAVDSDVPPRTVPADLDMPLSAYDPHAIPEMPAQWVSPPAPLMPAMRPQVFDDGERFETFELAPIADVADVVEAEPAAPEPRDFDPSASLHALLDRFEKGVTRRVPATAALRPASLQESLASLRQLATNR